MPLFLAAFVAMAVLAIPVVIAVLAFTLVSLLCIGLLVALTGAAITLAIMYRRRRRAALAAGALPAHELVGRRSTNDI